MDSFMAYTKAKAIAGLLRRDDLSDKELELCRQWLREIDLWLKERHEERKVQHHGMDIQREIG